MKKLFISLVCLFFANGIHSQTFSLSAKSGDVELDASLTEMNVKAKTDLPLFKTDLSVEFNIGLPKIDNLLNTFFMSPADVFMTLQVATIIGKDPDVVAQSYTKNKNKGWGAIAKELGIKPGSAEFHALKGKAKNKNKKEKGEKGKGKNKGKK